MKEIEYILINSLKEDLGDVGKDYTTLYCLRGDIESKFELLIKQDCIISGINIAKYIFNSLDREISFSPIKQDGDIASAGDVAFYVEGSSFSILKVERIVLNIMQRMSGVSTITNEYKNIISATKAKILDTRKTCPSIRAIDKLAIKIGGGFNHRFGLYDGILIKDNHIKIAGSIENTIDSIKYKISDIRANDLDIIIEVSSIEELKKVLEYNLEYKIIDRVMLDNFSVEDTKKAMDIIDEKLEVESSGNINKSNILAYAKCGVDYISIGELTHSVKSIDLSLKVLS